MLAANPPAVMLPPFLTYHRHYQYVFSMWEMFERRNVAKRWKHTRQKVLKRYESWKDIFEVSNPAGLELIRGFNEEALKRKWKRPRFSRLIKQYSVIYRIPSLVSPATTGTEGNS